MHITVAILTIMASFKWGKWNTWREYHASMLFIATGGLLYEYIVRDYSLWKFHPDFLLGHDMTVIVYALITMPVSVFLYLSHFPIHWVDRLRYIFLWSGIYIAVEWILLALGGITYAHGWTFWYSFLFDLVMFSVIALHHRYPLPTYVLSIFIIYFLISYFHVPFKLFKND
ncbi:CBO0543 family protein [Bacillus sp. V5-8f]|uniref:CBO0543 family protein n=1 Tax=Bacillus sp. V5-8f TaxID=2053044 RepID=UPI000C7645ED|nr:CBO0543 family protein [Bacillus sp. V5-8f]PLT33134.1 hypothetical protein CUU64_15240 [Bacillus sp. V5-8f]